ncbi:uncharacterized protein LOC141908350 [Tubulanus polymorphus]|uniref:uncharacterized protein LOC141908350 n=1 Tax=Tubulanus polymorphus TaxID=672921 RepID=UPI003DA27542
MNISGIEFEVVDTSDHTVEDWLIFLTGNEHDDEIGDSRYLQLCTSNIRVSHRYLRVNDAGIVDAKGSCNDLNTVFHAFQFFDNGAIYQFRTMATNVQYNNYILCMDDGILKARPYQKSDLHDTSAQFELSFHGEDSSRFALKSCSDNMFLKFDAKGYFVKHPANDERPNYFFLTRYKKKK